GQAGEQSGMEADKAPAAERIDLPPPGPPTSRDNRLGAQGGAEGRRGEEAVSGQVQEARPWGLLPHCRLSCPVLSEDHDVAPRVPLLERVTHGEDLAARRFPSGGRASPASARRRRRSATPPPGRAARGDDPAGPRRRADDAPASSPPCPPVEDGTGYTPRSRSKRRRAAA